MWTRDKGSQPGAGTLESLLSLFQLFTKNDITLLLGWKLRTHSMPLIKTMPFNWWESLPNDSYSHYRQQSRMIQLTNKITRLGSQCRSGGHSILDFRHFDSTSYPVVVTCIVVLEWTLLKRTTKNSSCEPFSEKHLTSSEAIWLNVDLLQEKKTRIQVTQFPSATGPLRR